MSIRPDNLTLDQLLQGRLFRIPDYQRAYSWETKQRQELFNDIQKLARHPNRERHHFMSTIVCLKTPEKEEVGADEFGIFSIVDGQQRLTSLIILLKALAKSLSKGDPTESRESQKINEILIKENRRLILLQTNHDSQSLFRSYLEGNNNLQEIKLETSAEKNMMQAFKECEDFVENQWKETSLALLKLIKNRLDFIFYVLEDEGSVHNTFEVLNSRGLEVDWLDKCKSILMGMVFEKFDAAISQEHIEELHNYWSKIYRTIGLKKVSGQEILRFAATLESDSLSKILSAEKAMDFFRSKCAENPENTIDVSAKFLKIAKQLETLNTNIRLRAITKISQARLLGVAIGLNTSTNSHEKKQIYKVWEKITFRIFGMARKDSRTKVGDYVKLAIKIYASNILSQDILNEFNDLGEQYPVKDIARQLQNSNCYEGWESELIYFFWRYEEYLSCQQGGSIREEIWEQVWNSSPTSTIEHIHPQNPNNTWIGKIGHKNKREYISKQTQRLGNLMILPPNINSQASNKSFIDKKVIYKNHGLLRLVEEIIQQEDWTLENINEREQRLIEWAEKEWE